MDFGTDKSATANGECVYVDAALDGHGIIDQLSKKGGWMRKAAVRLLWRQLKEAFVQQ